MGKNTSISLGNYFDQFVQSQVTTSKYKNVSEVIRARKGARVAIKAVAGKLAEQYWSLMVKGKEFVEFGANKYQEQLLQQKKKYLRRLTL